MPIIDTLSKSAESVSRGLFSFFEKNEIKFEHGLNANSFSTSFIDVTFTFENKKGKLENNEAYVVWDGKTNGAWEDLDTKMKGPLSLDNVEGQINIVVKYIDSKSSQISIQLTGIKCTHSNYAKGSQKLKYCRKSTGVFERKILAEL